jgi:hypothetical protein
MKPLTKCAGIAGVVIFAAGSAAWAQGYNPNPATPMSHASPKTQGSHSGQPPTQGMDGLTSFERAGQELYKDGYKNIYGWKRSAQGWSADAVQHGQKVHVIVADNGQITTVPRQ